MVDALKEEIEKLEKDPVEEQEIVELENKELIEETTEEVELSEPEQTELQEPTEDEVVLRQKAYKERQEQKKRSDQERRQAELMTQANNVPDTVKPNNNQDAILYAAAQLVQKDKYNTAIAAGERELRALEKDFVQAYPDYNEVVERALDATKMRMLAQGQDEAEIDAYLRQEKVLIADRAAAQGNDPVEAVYNEAKGIVSWLDQYAEKMGYQKPQGKAKTNLQAIREISKTSAVGTGRGTGAAKKTFDEMDDLEEIGQVTLGDLMSGNI